MRDAPREVAATALIGNVSLACCLILGATGAVGGEQRAQAARSDITISTILTGPSGKIHKGPLTLHFSIPPQEMLAPESVRGNYKFPEAGPGELAGTIGVDIAGHFDPLILKGTWFESSANVRCEHSYKDEVGPEAPAKEYWYWGSFTLTFADITYQRFRGKWGYCLNAPTMMWRSDPAP